MELAGRPMVSLIAIGRTNKSQAHKAYNTSIDVWKRNQMKLMVAFPGVRPCLSGMTHQPPPNPAFSCSSPTATGSHWRWPVLPCPWALPTRFILVISASTKAWCRLELCVSNNRSSREGLVEKGVCGTSALPPVPASRLC